MARLEQLLPSAAVRGVLPDSLVTVVSVQWFGSEALELTYKTPAGRLANELLYRHDEPRLEIAEQGRPWSFDGDGALFRLVSEANRIRLAHLSDPVLAVHTSVVDPLPHQITAVYEAMLPRYERIAFEKSLVAPRASRSPPSSAPATRCSMPPSTSPWSATATCCAAARCWSTSATPAPLRACSSTWSTPSRTQPHPSRRAPHRLRARAAHRSGCRRQHPPPALRALSGLPPAGAGRARRRPDPRPA